MASSPDQSSRDRSTSLGSGLPKHEHKRPRLDVHQDTERAGSDETLLVIASDSIPVVHERPQTPPQPCITPAVLSPTSKMTINTRPLSAQSNLRSDGSSLEIIPGSVINGMPEPASQYGLQSKLAPTPGGPDEPISIPSSPDDSVIIHISAPEEIEARSSVTTWSSISGPATDEIQIQMVASLWSGFPRLHGNSKQEVSSTVDRLMQFLEIPAEGVSYIRELGSWFERSIEQLHFNGGCSMLEDIEILKQMPRLLQYLYSISRALRYNTYADLMPELLSKYVVFALAVMRSSLDLLEKQPELAESHPDLVLLVTGYTRPLVSALHSTPDSPRRASQPSTSNHLTQIILQQYGAALLGQISHCMSRMHNLLPLPSPLRLHITSLIQDFCQLLYEKLARKIVLDESSEVSIQSVVTDSLNTSRDVLRIAIIKQQTWLNLANVEQYIDQYQELVRQSLRVSRETKTQILEEARLDDHTDEFLDDEPILLFVYKFSVLKLLLRHGRMELRVAAMTIMSTDLVQIYKGPEKLDLPQKLHGTMLQTMAQFLKNNTIVNYTLGLDSHPQIVERSHNTIGFLCVTGHWSADDTDIVWQAILNSQDPHMIPAIFQALSACVQHMKIPALEYVCRKVHDLVSDRFDHQTLAFVVLVLNKTLTKLAGQQGEIHDTCMNIIAVCKHLLIEAFDPAHYLPEIASMVKQNVTDMLVEWRVSGRSPLLALLSQDEQVGFSQEFQNEIAAHSTRVTGNTLILTMLLSVLDNTRAQELILQHDFAKLLIDDMVHHTKYLSQTDAASSPVLNVGCEIRLHCFQMIAVRAPSCISQCLCQTIWTDLIVNNKAPLIRDRIWLTLAEMCQAVQEPNSLLRYASEQLLSELPSFMLDRCCLQYAQNSMWLDKRREPVTLIDTEGEIHLPHMQHIWRILLESPSQLVAKAASDFIVKAYVKGSIFAGRPQSVVDLGRAAFVEKCVSIIQSCAQHTSIAEPDRCNGDRQHEMSATPLNRQKVLRCLDTLRAFVVNSGLLRNTVSPDPGQFEQALRAFQPSGAPYEVGVSISGHATFRDGKCSWVIGLDNTAAELHAFLAQLTGRADVFVRTDQQLLHESDSGRAIRDLDFTTLSISVECTRNSTTDETNRILNGYFNPEAVILSHLDRLCELLDHEEPVASAAYEFLASFPHQKSIVDGIRRYDSPHEELLPLQQPYRLLYNAAALRTVIKESIICERPDSGILRYAVDQLVTLAQGLRSSKFSPTLFLRVTTTALEIWLSILHTKLDDDTLRCCFESHDYIIADLLAVWQRACDSIESLKLDSANSAIQCRLFECVMLILLHRETLWPKDIEFNTFSALIARTLIMDDLKRRRQDMVVVICDLASTGSNMIDNMSDNSGPSDKHDPTARLRGCVRKLWKIIYTLLPQAIAQPGSSHEYFEASSVLLGTVIEQLNVSEAQQILEELQSVLPDHKNGEAPKTHIVILGVTRLIYLCARRIYSDGAPIPRSHKLLKDLFHTYLFPALSDDDNSKLEDQSVPVLDFGARAQIYDLGLLLCRSLDDFRVLVEQLDEVKISETAFRLTTSNDRRCLRSEQGYTGLYNLSNTCYLNSLFSQLFMNVKFRECLVNARIIDVDKQKLVYELAEVFALMQDSVEKAVSPERVVDSILQYDGEQIDVSVQMDVDEFFNLLFDRLESQMVDKTDRERLKSIFGGQLVQQIKSKQCEHVSERNEPFNALQIEIKGKKTLEEGLAAYVEGEVLQGENKYSCSGCGRLVEAVKRACLKQIPNNLIMNLKRFDYDIMTGQRCKVNDEFSFPDAIDMRPYSLRALSEPEDQPNADMFELVGVIIHAGTAEMGHYYSFARERPSTRPTHEAWIQFNDSDVTKFDVSQMGEQAFGGHSTDGPHSAFPKHYNGYMLFYQRSNHIQECAGAREGGKVGRAEMVILPPELDRKVARRNEEYLRQYVLQDPGHAKFIRVMFGQLDRISVGCTNSHMLEDDIIQLVLGYMSRVSSRSKDVPEVENTAQVLMSRARRCQSCAMCMLRWFNVNEHMTNVVMRSFYPTARKTFACMLTVSLQTLLTCYSPGESPDDGDQGYADDVGLAVNLCMRKLKKSWSLLQRFPRAWDPYFQVLQFVAKLRPHGALLLVENDFLERSLEIIWIHWDPGRILKRIRPMYEEYLSARTVRHKGFNYSGAIELFALLLPTVGLSSGGHSSGTAQAAPSDNERVYLQLDSNADRWTWLIKLISGRASENAAVQVVEELCQYVEYGSIVQYSLRTGLIEARTIVQATAYIRPMLSFIEHNEDRDLVSSLLEHVLAHIDRIDVNLLADFLDFVKDVCQFGSVACGLTPNDLIKIVRDHVGLWLPPLVMAPNEMHRDIRNEALMLADTVFFEPIHDKSDRAEVLSALRSLSSSIVKFLNENYISGDARTHQNLESGQSAQILRVMEKCAALLETAGAGEANTSATISHLRLASDELALAQEAAVDIGDMAWEDSEALSEAESLDGSVN